VRLSQNHSADDEMPAPAPVAVAPAPLTPVVQTSTQPRYTVASAAPASIAAQSENMYWTGAAKHTAGAGVHASATTRSAQRGLSVRDDNIMSPVGALGASSVFGHTGTTPFKVRRAFPCAGPCVHLLMCVGCCCCVCIAWRCTQSGDTVSLIEHTQRCSAMLLKRNMAMV